MAVSLEGLRVVVTGAGGGLGPAVVEAFKSAGAVVHAPSRKEMDLADEAAVARYYAALPDLWASVHVAGGFAMAPVEDTALSDFAAQWNVNTVTAFLCCREAVRAMKRSRAAGQGAAARGAGVPGAVGGPSGAGGRIVNVGSRAAAEGAPGKIAYVAAKSALLGMTRALAAEVRGDGILVNAVLPDTIDTPANRAAMPGADTSKWSRPSDIAGVIAWLAGPGNGTATGGLIPV